MIKYVIILLLFIFFIPEANSQNIQERDTLLVGIKMSPPFIYKNNSGELSGISIWLWERIAHDLHLDYQYVEKPLDVILKDLEKGSLDVSIVPLTVTNKRTKGLDFSFPFFVSNSTIAKAKTSKNGILQFISSFFTINFLKVIVFLFVIIFFFGFLVWIFERKNNKEFEGRVKGIWNGIWWSAVTMTTVGYGKHTPKSVPGRIIALIWMFTAIMIISSFTASVTSALTVNKLDSSPKTVHDFKEKKIGTVQSSASQLFLKNNFFSNYQGYPTIEQGVNALKNNELDAFIYDEPILKFTIKKEELDNIEVLPIKFYLQFYAFGFSKGNHDKVGGKVSKKIIEITETNDWKMLLSEYDVSVF